MGGWFVKIFKSYSEFEKLMANSYEQKLLLLLLSLLYSPIGSGGLEAEGRRAIT